MESKGFWSMLIVILLGENIHTKKINATALLVAKQEIGLEKNTQKMNVSL
jgi:hypothetical protein